MRITTILMLVFCMHLSAASYSQTISLSAKDMPLKEVFKAIEHQTGYLVWGKVDFLQHSHPVTITARNMELNRFLSMIMKDQPFTYKVKDNTIILSEVPGVVTPATVISMGPAVQEPTIDVSGFVMNAQTNQAVAGATISFKAGDRGYVTKSDGTFVFPNAPVHATITISCIGYATFNMPVERLADLPRGGTVIVDNTLIRRLGNGVFVISLKPVTTALTEVVINNGIFKRNKESFTGAVSTFTGDELKTIGNRNVLASLATLDPSLIKVDNNLQGSNPNKLPTLEIRGKTTLTNANLNSQFNADPNQPLFILDGFETTLQAIYDLDMNRVASITILKDAASTALYGAKASNGVVVVETKRPIPGRLQGSYVADLSLDLPDLSSYNLMNAAEKLQWEKLSSGTPSTSSGTNYWLMEERNAARRADVARGVNTYWLKVPVQTGITNKHSLQLNGGNNELTFNAGGLYSNQEGVMKGSGRKNWSGNMTVTYRKGRLNVTDQVMVSGNTATESPYGSFASYAAVNPYYRKTDSTGVINRQLDPIYDTSQINPLYNAMLYSINQAKTFSFSNNIRGIYTLSKSFRLEGALQLGKGNATGVVFIPPDNTQFDGVDAHQKGSYTYSHSENRSYTGNLTVAYGTVIGKSQVTAIARGQLQSNTSEGVSFSVVGFPYGTNGNPVFAYGFTPYSVPGASQVTMRAMDFTSSVNYAYDGRYMFDGVYTLNGASVFGSNKRYKPFVSGGLGWNLSREVFFTDMKWMNLLKLRANLGYSGNENLGNFTSVSTYSFVGGNNNTFGQGLSLASLGSPNLEWSKTLQGSYGLDFAFMNNRISGLVEYYNKKTDPLAVGANGTLPSSVALNDNYVINVGTLTTKGWNFNLRYSPVYNLKDRIVWTVSVSGVQSKSTYGGFGNRLAALNKAELDSKGLERYYDGYSPDDIWAVRSLGIDPATGHELYQKKNGQISFVYDPQDIARVGNTRPEVEGIVSTNFTYKDFSLGANARYRVGGYVFNSALYNKVENISLVNSTGTVVPNLDRRALYDRWQKPGDVAQFTSLTQYAANPISSRFVEEDNHIIGEAFNLGWRSSAQWIRNLRLQSLSATFYVNDIFRVESVKSERGLDYPFARSASFSLNVSF